MSSAVMRKSPVMPLLNPYTIFTFLGFGFAILFMLVRLNNENQGIDWLKLLMLVQLFPFAIAFSRRHFTYIGFIMLFHCLSLSTTKWIQFSKITDLDRLFPFVVQAIKEQLFCTVLIILAYYSIRSIVFQTLAEKEKYQKLVISRFQLILLGIYVIVVPAAIHLLPAWFLSIHFLLISADIILLFTCQCPGSEKMHFWLKVATCIGAFQYFLDTGMMTLLGALVYFAFLSSCMERRYGRIFLLLGVVALCSAIQTVKGEYRIAIREEPDKSISERVEILTSLLYLKYGEGIEAETEEEEDDKGTTAMLLNGFGRAGDDSLERVLAMTPSQVPFWEGETYASLPFIFIPRAIWGDKPTRHFWNKFGRSYGILSTDDVQTSVSVSFLAEGYMNFGYVGMYGIAILVGFLYALIERMSYFMLSGYYSFPFLVLLTPFLMPSTDFGSILNSLWMILMFMVAARTQLMRSARKDEYS